MKPKQLKGLKHPSEKLQRQILDFIRCNEVAELRQAIKEGYNMNFKAEYESVELDQSVTPLVVASFLGRTEIAKLLIDSKVVDINATTETTGKSCEYLSLLSSHDRLSQWQLRSHAALARKWSGCKFQEFIGYNIV